MGQLIIEDDLALQGQAYSSCDVAATGILQSSNSAGDVAVVNYLDAKITAACQAMGQGGYVFYPQANTDKTPLEPKTQQLVAENGITLVAVNTPQQALDYLRNLYGVGEGGAPHPLNGNGTGFWSISQPWWWLVLFRCTR